MATIKLLEETEMKKIMVGILTSALIFAVSASSAFAAAPEKRDNFVDANEDGICDNYSGEASFSQNMGRGVGSRGRWGK